MAYFLKKTKGFTVIELMISIVVLGLISTFTFSIYTNFFDSVRNLKSANLVYEESRFLMERIVKEVRNGTIDFEEYYNQSKLRQEFPDSYDYLRNETYAQDYCQYSRQFYGVGPDNEIGTLDDKSTGVRTKIDSVDGITAIPPAVGRLDELLTDDIATPIQDDLFLININGDSRTFIKRIEKEDSNENQVGKVGMLKMEGEDFGVDHLNAFDPMLNGSPPDPDCETDTGEGDGRIDTWVCSDGFPCEAIPFTNDNMPCSGVIDKVTYDPNQPADNSFLDITPGSIDVVDLKFIVSPMDDPRKAYNTDAVQIQPHVTIRLTVRPSPALSVKFRNKTNPNIVLETTISARAYNEIITECNLKQCTDGLSQPKDCPLTAGVCGFNDPSGTADPLVDENSQQSCSNYIWSGCSAAAYQTYSDDTYGVDAGFPGGARTYHESGSEFRSCNDDYDTCESACALDPVCIANCAADADICRDRRCTDGRDNDCSGVADEEDTACNFFLCNDGEYSVDVEEIPGCIDVGGLCDALRPVQSTETSCNDGHDNDCDGFADQFDADCVRTYCTNGTFDADTAVISYTNPTVDLFLSINYLEQEYLLNATPADHVDNSLDECSDVGATNSSPDIGGICELCVDSLTGDGACECGTGGCTNTKVIAGHDQQASETGSLCYDNLDNDCDGDADEFDAGCRAAICENVTKNCALADNLYTPTDYLFGYTNVTCEPFPTNQNDEVCVDVGGLCEGYINGAVDHTYRDGGEIAGAADDGERTDLCNDGLNNDCAQGADWQDDECCTSGDGDAYPAEGDEGGNVWCTLPLSATPDCNDNDNTIFPGATEVCDNDVYPPAYAVAALIGQPIDNDCDADDDSIDADCCIDNDGDDWGLTGNFTSCPNFSGPDCNDSPGSGGSINPGATESGLAGNCMDESGTPGNEFPVNNNCSTLAISYGITPVNTTVPQANHIDWYRNKNLAWLSWYSSAESFDDTDYVGTGGLDMAYTLELFEPACCNLTAMEVCDDDTFAPGEGSDENCSGKEGYEDDYCITADNLNFFETFTSTDYIAGTDAGIDHDTDSGLVTLTNPAQVNQVISSSVLPLDLSACTTYDIGLSAVSLTEPGTSAILFQFSDDGGVTWCGDDDCVGDWIDSTEAATALVSFDQQDLRWQAQLSGDATNSPSLSDITFTYSSCL